MRTKSVEDHCVNIELFDSLDESELALAKKLLKKRIVKSNAYLFREGSPRDALFIICKGEIEILKHDHSGEQKRLIVFGPGDFTGEGSLLDDYPHSTSARALGKTAVLCLPRLDFKAFLARHPKIAGKIISKAARIMSRRLRHSGTAIPSVGAQYLSGRTRKEHDLLGQRDVPYEAYYGIQTLRALENFNITGVPISHYSPLIEALARVKLAALRANRELGLIGQKTAQAIEKACCEIIKGRFHIHFTVDLIQGGAGTSTNMNANEVIANRALEILGFEKGDYGRCHPNNHVNLSQSTNDVYPTSLKIAVMDCNDRLTKVLAELAASLREKAREFARVIKMGRTQLQDAVPTTLGRTFMAYAVTVSEEIDRLNENARLFLEVNMGGTAIGTGITADPCYGEKVIKHLRKITGRKIRLAPDLVEATQDTGAFVIYSCALKRLAVKLSKIASDLRLLSSGPRAGINEINLPPMQPGSSIMPGKVNPVICEVLNQICYKVIGNDLAVTLAAEAGQLELNVMEPLIAQSIFESIEMLKNGITTFIGRCIKGITANENVSRKMVENSIGLVTALLPELGYDKCTEIAREAMEKNVGVYGLVLKKKLLSKERLNRLLNPENMTGGLGCGGNRKRR